MEDPKFPIPCNFKEPPHLTHLFFTLTYSWLFQVERKMVVIFTLSLFKVHPRSYGTRGKDRALDRFCVTQ